MTFSLSVFGVKIDGSEREFSYEDSGAVLALAPRMGPTTGGTDVELIMRNPRRHVNLYCLFDGRRVTPTSVTVSSVICKSPRHNKGEAKVEVWSETGVLSGEGLTFWYTSVVEVVGAKPSIGPVHGGVKVEVHGSGFESFTLQSALCRFGYSEVIGSVSSSGVI